MNKKEIKKVKKHFMAFLAIFLILFILLGIQILFINLNGAYYGKWFQKYYSFLKNNSVYPKQKSIFFSFIVFGIASFYYLIKFLILKAKNKKQKK